MPQLTQNIISPGKDRRLYGKKGEQVTIISDHGNVLIVQGEKERFSVKREWVTNNR